jgi:hypothetical protein
VGASCERRSGVEQHRATRPTDFGGDGELRVGLRRLLLAWWQNRKVPALALWALGNFVDTAGIFCLMVGPVLRRPVLIMVADALVALGPGLIWKAARSLDGKPAPWAIVVIGGVVAGLASALPATRAAIDTTADTLHNSNRQVATCPRADQRRRTEVFVPYIGSGGAIGWHNYTPK